MRRITKSAGHRIIRSPHRPLSANRVLIRGVRGPNERILPTITQQDNGAWLFEWTAGALPARVFHLGKLIETVTTREYEFNADGYENMPPVLEIVGYGVDAESELYPTYATLQWRGVSTAAHYIVQHKSGSNWIDRRTLPEDESGTYTYDTPSTDDQTIDDWRILPVDALGRTGTPLAFSFIIVCNPSMPVISYAISAGTLTVAGA